MNYSEIMNFISIIFLGDELPQLYKDLLNFLDLD